jgi:glycosyltransferase involved in cell wall biosynthesis
MKISVVIPAYNAEKFLQRSVQSVLEQTEKPFEIIVVDDGSKDNTAGVAAKFGKQIQFVTQTNGGPAKARNTGMRMAQGDWIAFLDADDWWMPEKLRLQKEQAIVNPRAVVVYCGMQSFDGAGNSLGKSFTPAKNLWPQLRWRNMLTPSVVMVKREALLALNGFDENQKGCEDWGAWFSLFQRGEFIGIAEPLTCYSRLQNSLSSNAAHMFQDFSKMLEGTLLADLHGLRKWIWRRRIISYQAYTAAITARAADAAELETTFLLRSLTHWPSPFWQPKRYASLFFTLRRRMKVHALSEKRNVQ